MEEILYTPAGRPLVTLTDTLPSSSAASIDGCEERKIRCIRDSEGSLDVTELNFSITKWVWPMMSFPEFNRVKQLSEEENLDERHHAGRYIRRTWQNEPTEKQYPVTRAATLTAVSFG
jgi:hypothetical protein